MYFHGILFFGSFTEFNQSYRSESVTYERFWIQYSGINQWTFEDNWSFVAQADNKPLLTMSSSIVYFVSFVVFLSFLWEVKSYQHCANINKEARSYELFCKSEKCEQTDWLYFQSEKYSDQFHSITNFKAKDCDGEVINRMMNQNQNISTSIDVSDSNLTSLEQVYLASTCLTRFIWCFLFTSQHFRGTFLRAIFFSLASAWCFIIMCFHFIRFICESTISL